MRGEGRLHGRSARGRGRLVWLQAIFAGCVFAGFVAATQGQMLLPSQSRPIEAPQRLARTPESPGASRELDGTAFFVDDSGHMLTARHAVEDCVQVLVSKEGFVLSARVLARSDDNDIALIKVWKTLGLAAVFPRTATASVNETVFASAYDALPGKLIGSGVIANAIVASSGPAGLLAINSDVTFGASGAPVIDSRGLVQGVVSRRTASDRVLAVGAGAAKAFLSAHGVRIQEDDRAQLAGNGSRARRAASISAHVTCLER
jgi:S1-C subfamily serine protease